MPNHDQYNRSVVLLGGSGHAAVVVEAARSNGWQVLGYGDDASSDSQLDVPHLGSIQEAIAYAQQHAAAVHCAVGDASLRRRWTDAAGVLACATITHQRATVSESAQIAPGVFLSVGAIVNARASIGTSVIVNTAAVIEHDCIVGEFSHVAPRAVLTGNARIGAACMIGAGAIILPGQSIGDGATVGAGAVVNNDVPARATVVGVPARPLGIAAV